MVDMEFPVSNNKSFGIYCSPSDCVVNSMFIYVQVQKFIQNLRLTHERCSSWVGECVVYILVLQGPHHMGLVSGRILTRGTFIRISAALSSNTMIYR